MTVTALRDLIGRLLFRIGFPGLAGWWDAGTDARRMATRRSANKEADL